MFLSYSTFISKLNNYKILYISQLGFKSKKEEDQFIKIIDNNYFKNWHKNMFIHLYYININKNIILLL